MATNDIVVGKELRKKIDELGFVVEPGDIGYDDEFHPKTKDDIVGRCDPRTPIVVTNPRGERKRVFGPFNLKLSFCAPDGGIAFCTTRGELIREFYELNDDEYCYAEHGYSKKSGDFLDQAAIDIGLKSHGMMNTEDRQRVLDGEPEIRFVDHLVDDHSRAGVVLSGNDYYLLIDIYCPDDILYEHYRFDHDPSDEDITTAFAISKMQHDLRGKPECYTCASCGRELHWTESTGDNVRQKALNYANKSCGCDGAYEFYAATKSSTEGVERKNLPKWARDDELSEEFAAWLEMMSSPAPASREEMISECITRMEYLMLDQSCVQAFKNGVVMKSAAEESIAEISPLLDEEKWLIDEFEKKSGAVVYHVIRKQWYFGDCLDLFFVGANMVEWQSQKELITQNSSYVWSYNLTNSALSEAGYIKFIKTNGALLRTD